MAKSKTTTKRKAKAKPGPATGWVWQPKPGPVDWTPEQWDGFYASLPGIRWTRECGSDVLMYHKPPGEATEVVAIRFNVSNKPSESIGSIVKERRETT